MLSKCIIAGRKRPKKSQFKDIIFTQLNSSGGSRAAARGARAPPLFLDQTEAQRAEKKIFGDRPPSLPYLRVWMTVPSAPPISRSRSGTVLYFHQASVLAHKRNALLQGKVALHPVCFLPTLCFLFCVKRWRLYWVVYG